MDIDNIKPLLINRISMVVLWWDIDFHSGFCKQFNSAYAGISGTAKVFILCIILDGRVPTSKLPTEEYNSQYIAVCFLEVQ